MAQQMNKRKLFGVLISVKIFILNSIVCDMLTETDYLIINYVDLVSLFIYGL